MDLSKYKNFRRIYPKLRLSKTLYYSWIGNDWVGVWDYLTDSRSRRDEALEIGILTHQFLQYETPQSIVDMIGSSTPEQKLEVETDRYIAVGIPDRANDDWVVEYKTITGPSGGQAASAYVKELNCYGWLKSQSGSYPKFGLVAKILPIVVDGKIKSVSVASTSIFDLNKQRMDEWELIFDAMSDSIYAAIESGKLADYIRLIL